MSFFKDFKADFSQAMNELMPDSNEMYDEDEVVEEENTKKKDKAAAKAEKQAKRAARSKKTEAKEDREDRKVKSVRPPKELPLKSKVVEEDAEEDLGIAPEDMSDQIDELLDQELYSNENDPAMLLQDDTEVNTMDMSVAELLNQLSEKQEPQGEQLSVDDLLSQLGQPSPMEEMEEEPEVDSEPAEQQETFDSGKDMGLEELLASIGGKQETPAAETIPEAIESTEAEQKEELEAIEDLPEEETEEELEETEVEEPEEELLEEEPGEETEPEELSEEMLEEEQEFPEEEEEPEEYLEEDVEELLQGDSHLAAEPERITRSDVEQDEDELLTRKLEELSRSMDEKVSKQEPEPSMKTVEDTIQEEETFAEEPADDITENVPMAEDETSEETTEADVINNDEIIENPEENKMSKEKDVISISSVEEQKPVEATEETVFNVEDADDETTYVTKATKISGDLETEGSIDIIGIITGNVSCKGKIVVGGQVTGNIIAGELYANNAKIEGDIKSYGSVKVGVGSMIIGGIVAESAVIAGAVNGDIDVKGPVIVDSTAVIMGNIKSRSVQINNGAVIEGFCSQGYSDIDVKSYFA